MSAPEMLSDVRGTGRGPTAGYLGVIFRRAPLPATALVIFSPLRAACVTPRNMEAVSVTARRSQTPLRLL